MHPSRFQSLTSRYPALRIAIVGDFCLDRYFEIDPTLQETSLETGLPVHNVVDVRSQPGAGGTILNNLVALGIGTIHPVGFAGDDPEGRSLCRILASQHGVRMGSFFCTPMRRTFCYTKPIVVQANQPPVELNRLDFKNWTPTPAQLQSWLVDSVRTLAGKVDAILVLDQVDVSETGVVTKKVRTAIGEVAAENPDLVVIADSRRGLRDWPRVSLKMNAKELAELTAISPGATVADLLDVARALAKDKGRPVFVTLSDRGILGAAPNGDAQHFPSLPLRGPIDIVGAGDAVTANLAAALAAGANLSEALELANAAASVVIHQLGTTGTASVRQLAEQVLPEPSPSEP